MIIYAHVFMIIVWQSSQIWKQEKLQTYTLGWKLYYTYYQVIIIIVKLTKNGKANAAGGRPTQSCCATKQNRTEITKQKCVETKKWFLSFPETWDILRPRSARNFIIIIIIITIIIIIIIIISSSSSSSTAAHDNFYCRLTSVSTRCDVHVRRSRRDDDDGSR